MTGGISKCACRLFFRHFLQMTERTADISPKQILLDGEIRNSEIGSHVVVRKEQKEGPQS